MDGLWRTLEARGIYPTSQINTIIENDPKAPVAEEEVFEKPAPDGSSLKEEVTEPVKVE